MMPMRRLIELLKFEGIAGAIGSLALHLAILALIVSFRVQTDLSEQPELLVPAAPLMATVFLYDEPAAPPVEHYDDPPAPPLERLDTISVPLPPLPVVQAVAADSFEAARTIENLEDLEEVERLQGIYVKQVSDRVARLLETAGPRVTSGERCIVYVIQGERGDVIDVDMYECRRVPEERQRLAQVIRAASPLPLPPEGLAMGSYIKLDASSL